MMNLPPFKIMVSVNKDKMQELGLESWMLFPEQLEEQIPNIDLSTVRFTLPDMETEIFPEGGEFAMVVPFDSSGVSRRERVGWAIEHDAVVVWYNTVEDELCGND